MRHKSVPALAAATNNFLGILRSEVDELFASYWMEFAFVILKKFHPEILHRELRCALTDGDVVDEEGVSQISESVCLHDWLTNGMMRRPARTDKEASLNMSRFNAILTALRPIAYFRLRA